MIKIFTILLLAFYSISANAQSKLQIVFHYELNNHPIKQDSSYKLENDEAILKIKRLKWYSSHWMNDIKNLVFLHDAFISDTINFDWKPGKYASINFLLGTDSVTNLSGIQEGSLDPMNGMFWTWNSGYINWKFEGLYSKNNQTKKFEHHLGGYKKPFQAFEKINLHFPKKIKFKKNKNYLMTIKINHDDYLNKDFSAQNIMEPGKLAQEKIQKIAKLFSISKIEER